MAYDAKAEAHLLKNATQSTCECSHETLADALARAFAEGRLAGLEEAAAEVLDEDSWPRPRSAETRIAMGCIADNIRALAGRSDGTAG